MPTGPAGCALTAGKTYYINILFENPSDGIQSGRDTCDPNHPAAIGGVCDAMFDLK